MRMIIGGAYQGKTDYVIKKYNIDPDEIMDGTIMSLDKLSELKCINGYHLFVKRLLENGCEPIEITGKILNQNPDVIIIMNEIGNGIIPIEKSERIWREQVGKVGCFLAERAESVERIICGQAVMIKKVKLNEDHFHTSRKNTGES